MLTKCLSISAVECTVVELIAQWSYLIERVGRNSNLVLKLIMMVYLMQITSFHLKMVPKCVKRMKNGTFLE